MSRYSNTDTYSQAGDWLAGAARRNPEALLLLAAGCCLLMRSRGISSSRAASPGRYGGMEQGHQSVSDRLSSGAGRTASNVRDGLSRAADGATDYASEIKDRVSETASAYADSISEFAQDAGRSVSERSTRLGRQARRRCKAAWNASCAISRLRWRSPGSPRCGGGCPFPSTDIEAARWAARAKPDGRAG
jgi:hypothetical protein